MSSRVKEDVQKLFEFWCEVTKAESGNVLKQTGHIIQSFPENYRDDQIITKIPDFAYPCEFENESVQSYSFVLTSDDSKWRFGFCRHDPKTQTAMVIITYLPWHDTFLRLLGVLGELRRTKNGEFESFLAETYSKGVPEPGASLKLFYNAGTNHFIFQRPSQFQLPSIPENHNLNLYYNFVDPKNMISVFAAMLSERRIVFTSRRLDKLSSCIQAANAFLYPMVWQHIFIPVLPMKLKDILSAPMPYLIGVPKAVLETMTPEELGDVVTLNCDNKTFENPFDDLRQMPPELVHQMKKSLSNSQEHIGDRVSRIFLGILVQLIGGYRDAVRFSNGQKITWDQESFIDSRPPHLRPFLTRMMELQIFHQFIDERLEMLNTGLGFSDEFEIETLRHAEKMGKRGRNYREFLKNVKDKTNPAVKSAVKSVKESSRGVKTAYKDLKSKFRDVTPPKSQFHISTSHSNSYSGNAAAIVHRSAPNSPVFSRRHTTLEFTNKSNHAGTLSSGAASEIKQLTTSTSNSHFQNGYNDSNTINNNHMNLSPTISPSSSLCSSDMNLTQELQNHPLFKSPMVDRSLKPSSSLDSGYHRISSRYGGALITTPATLPHTVTTSRRPPKTNSPQALIAPPIMEVPMGNLCIIDLDELHDKSDAFAIVTTNSVFDIPPDMPSPPVPPRRTNSNRNSAKQKIVNKNIENGAKDGENDTTTLIAFENDFVVNGAIDVGKNSNLLLKPPSRPSRTSQVVQRTNQEQKQQEQVVPIPTPRQKPKELSKSQMQTPTQASFDLITLDDGNDSNNTNFEIEDFDPLNHNAKPIPQLKLGIPSATQTKSTLNESGLQQHPATTLSHQNSLYFSSTSTISNIDGTAGCTIPSVHNPIYPYFTPQHHQRNHHGYSGPPFLNTTNNTKSEKEDDFELLKKYGLDQFTLTSNGTLEELGKDGRKIMGTGKNLVTDSGNSINSINTSKWTTFD